MFAGMKNFFRKRMLRKNESDIQTGMIPLQDIKTAIVLMDVENPDYDLLEEKVLGWFNDNRIKCDIWNIDFRKADKNTQIRTDISKTITKKELNWIGAPSQEKFSKFMEQEADLFISLTDKDHFANILMSKCSKAGFKIGRTSSDQKTYDIVFQTEADSQTGNSSIKVFEEITTFLKKINQ